ncbi:MdtA/MuxA family multidrug efflux RND transporter periplasmic adaptor subunit [Mesoterricola silvestris]|uniref:Multidrug resistance protein MdtA n=1 Tax=Mesoterricola silvestris TaxID=2927979 RepID=A0AA48K9S0_9BACT|nr:MdtA/MuxA family multidrug efflux RND transporter periplasmic adaptor subunit [Mesoterricola silvestris]BDU74269.1 multidrug resistance protein MdtA [Mesoterricola silvestris]
MDANESVIHNAVEAAAPRRGWKVWLGLAVAVAVLATVAVKGLSGGAKPAPPQRAVPVATGVARIGDMPVNLSGLGTVVPTDAVTVKTRVDGQIMKIHFREGQLVNAGDLLITIDPRPYQVQLLQAEGQMAKDQSVLRNARMDLARIQSLFDQKIVSRQQLDTQSALVDQCEAAVKADTGSVENAKLNLTYSRITAPVSGKVGLRLVDTGNTVKASDTTGLVTLTPVSPINVLFSVPADNVQNVLDSSRGGKVPVVEVFDRDMTKKLASGTLLAVDNQVDATTGTVRIKAQFANKDGALFPNQFVNARLLVDTLKGALMIPAAAVQRSPNGTFVYVIKPDATVELRIVEPQATEGDVTALRKGLNAGEKVVVSGLDKLRPGSKVLEEGQGAPKAAK